MSIGDAVIDPWKVIQPDEFRARQDRVRASAAEQGFDGALVWSRGGAFMDMSADVLYLTNHYSQQPYMGDDAGIGAARSHGVCVLPVNGPASVVVDVPWWRRDLVVADDVLPSIHVPRTAAEAVRRAGLERGRLALVGASYMTAAAYLGLVEALPDAEIVRADRLVEDVRIHKSPAEIELIRAACALGNQTLEALIGAVVEGATEADAVAAASQTLIAGGGVLYDAACASGPWAHAIHARAAAVRGRDAAVRARRHVPRRLLRLLRRLLLRLRAFSRRGRRPDAAAARPVEAAIELVETSARRSGPA